MFQIAIDVEACLDNNNDLGKILLRYPNGSMIPL